MLPGPGARHLCRRDVRMERRSKGMPRAPRSPHCCGVNAALLGAVENYPAGLGAQFCQTRRAHGSHEPQKETTALTAAGSTDHWPVPAGYQSAECRRSAGVLARSPPTETDGGGPAKAVPAPYSDPRQRSAKRPTSSRGRPERAGSPRSDRMDSAACSRQNRHRTPPVNPITLSKSSFAVFPFTV